MSADSAPPLTTLTRLATRDLLDGTDLPGVVGAMRSLMQDLFPICRSITGDGVRETLRLIAQILPISTLEVPTGAAALDWTVPKEWNIREAWIKAPDGQTIVDFANSNLHVVSYSTPVAGKMTLEELRPHLHSLPSQPTLTPYRTSYYSESWGFCLPHEQLESLTDGEYEVCIDSSLTDGFLSYGELIIAGESSDEVLLTTHICHPSLANDNLSGIALLAALGKLLMETKRRYTYRLLFIPGTIGSLCWLQNNPEAIRRIRHGVVITGVADAGMPTWKRSRRGLTEIDRAFVHILESRGREHRIMDFYPYGYDERQFCSPGFDLPVGRFGRSVHGEYPEYHTSADNLEFVQFDQLLDSLEIVAGSLDVVDNNEVLLNTLPFGEPQLGRRGLYSAMGGAINRKSAEMALLWNLNLADGSHSLLDIAERSGLPFKDIRWSADQLRVAGLLVGPK